MGTCEPVQTETMTMYIQTDSIPVVTVNLTVELNYKMMF